MIISCDISDNRADAIDRLNLDSVRDQKTLRILYYLAGEADRLNRDQKWPIEAGMASDLFDDAVTAVRRGELT